MSEFGLNSKLRQFQLFNGFSEQRIQLVDRHKYEFISVGKSIFNWNGLIRITNDIERFAAKQIGCFNHRVVTQA